MTMNEMQDFARKEYIRECEAVDDKYFHRNNKYWILGQKKAADKFHARLHIARHLPSNAIADLERGVLVL